MQWFAQAPSNIALIKYMGKKDSALNLPLNASLSYTLPHLLSSVMLESHRGKHDLWEPLEIPGGEPLKLSCEAQQRFLHHLHYLKTQFHYSGSFIVRSANNFPHGSGLASSASSFAALTKCALLALSELTHTPLPSMEEQSQWSRLGSGSSCRSFFAPWALWKEDRVSSIQLPYSNLLHHVILISQSEKKISSSEAHERVKTSAYYPTRATLAEQNLKTLLNALEWQDWKQAYHICWREFHDLHQLFATATPAFHYITSQTNTVLRLLQSHWEQEGDGPLVTMDAGPNIHLLYRPDQAAMAFRFKQTHLLGNYDVL